MAEISAALVKELRDMTGAGMMECKNALVEADGDIDKAVDILRTMGIAKAVKKAGRETNEGTVMALVSEDGTKGSLVELNCETDFVAMNDKFTGFAAQLAQAVIDNAPADAEAMMDVEIDGAKVSDMITENIHTIGENMNLARIGLLEESEGAVASYIHGVGKIGVLVAFKLGNAATKDNADFQAYAKDVCMQVAAASPVAATRENVPADVVEKEMEIYKAQAAESGKPEEIQEKIAQGRMDKFYKESCLTEQEFVKNPDQSINEYTDEVAKKVGDTIEIVDFLRYQLGE